MYEKWKWELLNHVWLLATPWTVACQAPLPMGFSRLEYWSGLSFSSPGDLPNPGIESKSHALQVDSLSIEPHLEQKVRSAVRNKVNFSQIKGWGFRQRNCISFYGESSTGLGPKKKDNLDRHRRRGGGGEVSGEAVLDCWEPTSGPTSIEGLSHSRDLSFGTSSQNLGCLCRIRCNEINSI